MDFLILEDSNGGTAILTTNSPASHYGIPVLQISADDVDGDFGPSDMIGDIERPETLTTAANVVFAWAMEEERTEAELNAARSYLQQWPEGPQIDGD